MRVALLFLALVSAGLAQVADRPSANSQQRTALRLLATAAPDVQWDLSSLIRGDIACDGRSDQAYVGHAKSKIYVGLYRARTGKAQILEFHVDGIHQDAICRETAKLTVEALDYDPDLDLRGYEKSKICKGLILSDGACDPLHFFWNHATSMMNWWRN